MTDTDLNLRFNTLMMVNLLSAIFSWLTPYPWWMDVMLIGAMGAGNALEIAFKK